ncbi:hypothetical protein N7474_009780 [Penicillium riverlandense]|uniref:uncharacterized protein n=1 Tax=Penicillium riverlandense TaxID=1903569 RepID=UPI002547EDEA|nr:uncharacterized protein N7474_009780 [Penicillium riverlandense]KAJ5808511.1 hypothetical protein N7474_009780 [Penicillium riverlandense]
MGTFTFQWPYNANEVYVTGTFDDWGKTVQLDRVGDIFLKEVSLPATSDKIQYKFVVDGTWTTDSRVREETDEHNNVNNVLLPNEITPEPTTMSGVTPDSTTAALAAAVPKEEANGSLPGTFPDTPGQESEQMLSVNPIPASGGIGNPVKLNPGEKVPDPGSINDNTVHSTVKLDKESYEKGDSVPLASAGSQNPTTDTAGSSAFSVPPVSKNTIPESSLPMGGGPAQRAAATDMTDPGYTIQSAAPNSTTAALAANVPLEKTTNGDPAPVSEVPQIVKDSIAEAHQDPEAAANQSAVEEKKDMEQELHKKVSVEESAGTPAPTVSATTQPTAPGHLTVASTGFDSADVSPNTTPPPGRATAADAAPPTSVPVADSKAAVSGVGQEQIQPPSGPTVTTGVASAPTTETTTPKETQAPAQQSATTEDTAAVSADAKEEKKKKRLSGFFSKIKEKLK